MHQVPDSHFVSWVLKWVKVIWPSEWNNSPFYYCCVAVLGYFRWMLENLEQPATNRCQSSVTVISIGPPRSLRRLKNFTPISCSQHMRAGLHSKRRLVPNKRIISLPRIMLYSKPKRTRTYISIWETGSKRLDTVTPKCCCNRVKEEEDATQTQGLLRGFQGTYATHDRWGSYCTR